MPKINYRVDHYIEYRKGSSGQHFQYLSHNRKLDLGLYLLYAKTRTVSNILYIERVNHYCINTYIFFLRMKSRLTTNFVVKNGVRMVVIHNIFLCLCLSFVSM